jgi:uncharacterized protein (TIGR02118 family)
MDRWRRNFQGCANTRKAKDATRKHPGWNAVVELYFDNWEAMEAAWRSPEGAAATADLVNFVDLERTTWSAVEERNVR